MTHLAAREHYERAITALWTWRGDPLAAARNALREAPDFVAARLLVASVLLFSRDPREGAAGRQAIADLAGLPMDERQKA